MSAITLSEASERFLCFGSDCAVFVGGGGPLGDAPEAAAAVRTRLLGWHTQFSRFEPASELSAVNSDPRPVVPVSPVMARLVESIAAAGLLTGGLVDGTMVDQVAAAGYAEHLEPAPVPLGEAVALAPPRRLAGASPRAGFRELSIVPGGPSVHRPPGLKLDSGGIAKGLFGDLLAEELAGYASFAIDCAGDIRVGGVAGCDREVEVADPFEDRILHRFALHDGAVATSGIGRRSWLHPDGRPAHHLIDPATGEPAFTGIVQVSALAPTGVLAEVLSKAALLSGPDGADRWLTRGGVIVYDDGSHRVVDGALLTNL